ncbi:MAG: hypothetical protein C0631_02845 [Sedimenticola sp.]|mgnify:CR=1 FL=1|nr:MAG: hypothetical protein C0631_02845 [Sedimenticola sp.]
MVSTPDKRTVIVQSESKFEVGRVPLCEIDGVHRTVQGIKALSVCDYLLKDVHQISEKGMQVLLEIVPIIVTVTKKSILVVGGFRSYQIAQEILRENNDKTVPVLILQKKVREKELIAIATASIFSVPLAIGLNFTGAAQIGYIACCLDPSLLNSQRGRKSHKRDRKLEDIFMNLRSLTSLAEMIKTHPTTLRSMHGTQQKLDL